MKKRLIELDAIKGVAIILMVYGHITYLGNLKALQGDIKAFIYTFHMPLFLLISGYLFTFQTERVNRMTKTIRMIGVPYLLFIIVYLSGLILASKLGIHINKIPPD
ncbi:MAG: acyltransferase family protein, partial [Campylobacterales bacterium]